MASASIIISSIGIVLLICTICMLYILNYTFHYNESCQLDPPVALKVIGKKDRSVQASTTMLQPTCDVFSDTYQEARNRFRYAVTNLEDNQPDDFKRLITLESLVIYPGISTPNHFSMDIGVIHGTGPGLVFQTSGVHGVEGYGGSAIQLAFLEMLSTNDHLKLSMDLPTIVLIHAYNPYGMAHYRRWNENNIDLNLNSITSSQWKKYSNEKQESDVNNMKLVNDLLNPTIIEPTWFFSTIESWLRLLYSKLMYGFSIGGASQYHKPYGIFYGGDVSVDQEQQQAQYESSTQNLNDWLVRFFNDNPHFNESDAVITWIDFHTGQGSSMGDYTFFPASSSEGTSNNKLSAQNDYIRNEMKRWFPKKGNNEVNPIDTNAGHDKGQGRVIDYFYQTFFQHQSKALIFAQELGTVPSPVIEHALIVENLAYQFYTNIDNKINLIIPGHHEYAVNTTKAAFYPNSKQWRKDVLQKGIRVLQQAIIRTMQLSSSSTTTASSSSSNQETVTSGESFDQEL